MIFFLLFFLLVFLLFFRKTRWSRATELKGWKYKFNKKKVDHIRALDCSAYVSHIIGVHLGSWELVEQAQGVFQTLRLDESMLKENTLVAYDSGDYGFDRGRSNGVDHVGIVLAHQGQLYLCECSYSQGGVVIQPVQEGLAYWNKMARASNFGETYLDGSTIRTKTFYVGQI